MLRRGSPSASVLPVLLFAACVSAPDPSRWSELPAPAESGKDLPEPERAVRFLPGGHSVEFRNGMLGVLMIDPDAEMVTVGARYRVGAADDPVGKEGLAHLVEHLLFEQRPGGPEQRSIGELLGDVAVLHNATTTWDATHYYAVAPRERLEELVRLESLRLTMGCHGLDEATFAVHREVVLNELRTRPSSPTFAALRAAAYSDGHPYRRPIGGTAASIARLTLADACQFIRDHYDPARVILTMSGKITRDEMLELTRRWLEPVPRRTLPPRTALPARVTTARRVEEVAEVAKPRLLLAWPLPSRYGDQGVASELLRLQLRFELARVDSNATLAESISVSRGGGELAPLLVIAAELAEDADVGRVERRLQQTVDELPDRFALGRFRFLQALMQLDLLRRIDPLPSRTDVIADYVQFDRTKGWYDADVLGIDRTTLDQVRELARATLRSEHRITVVVRPDPNRLTTLTDEPETSIEPHSSARWKQYVDPAAADRPFPYELGASLLERAERYRLANGLQVVLLRSFFAPTMRMQLVFRTGFLDTAPEQAGLASAAVELLVAAESTGWGTYVDAAQVLEGLFFKTDTSSGPTTTTFEAFGFSSLQDFAIQGLGARFRAGTYPTKETGEVLTRMRKRLSTKKEVRRQRLRKILVEELFGKDHPYASHPGVSSESVARLDVPSLTAFRDRHLVADNATLIVTGRVDPKITRAHVEGALAAWPGGSQATRTPVQWPSLPDRTAPVHLALPAKSERMLEVAIAYPTATAIDEHYATRLIAGEMLAMRLMAVRERLGAAYLVSGEYIAGVGPGQYLVSSTVDGARGGAALAAMRAAVASLARSDDFAVDFVLARRRVVERLLAARLDRSALADQLAFLVEHDLSFDFYTGLTARVAAATQADVRRTVARDLSSTRELTVVAGDLSSVRAAYAGAGITDVRAVEQ